MSNDITEEFRRARQSARDWEETRRWRAILLQAHDCGLSAADVAGIIDNLEDASALQIMNVVSAYSLVVDSLAIEDEESEE